MRWTTRHSLPPLYNDVVVTLLSARGPFTPRRTPFPRSTTLSTTSPRLLFLVPIHPCPWETISLWVPRTLYGLTLHETSTGATPSLLKPRRKLPSLSTLNTPRSFRLAILQLPPASFRSRVS